MKIKFHSLSIASLLLLTIAVSFTSCSTKKNTFTRRAFHNLIAHYNPYWNGYEAYKQGLRELDKQIKINYTEILPVVDYGTLQDAQAINSYMDRAIEKASKVAQRHSMFFERRERVRRVPDSYILIGKAHFYKHDYFNARLTFEYVATRYERQPIRFNAHLWQARTAIMLREFERSVTILDNLQNQVRRSDFPRELPREIPVVYAMHYMGLADYEAAKPHLRKAAELSRDKDFKARLYYILGQIHQQEGAFAEASRWYERVISQNPNYDMRFSAIMRQAECFDSSRGSSRQLIADLNKLLRDKKNEEYHDQIHYALAQIALRENDQATAIEHLQKSVAASVSNDFQKVISARALAELYFAIPKYQDAYAYYDTTMQAIQFNHPDYSTLDQKTSALRELVQHLNVIELQDSLQMIAALPEAERNKIVDQIIAEYKAEQERIKREEEMLAQAEANFVPLPGRDPSRGRLQQVTGAGGGWYFYNPQTITFGQSEFRRLWGRRKLEDNWRLSDKRTYDDFDFADMLDPENDTIEGEGGGRRDDPLKKETYLKNIPDTPEKIEESNRQIAAAMYQLAYVFREGFRDYPKSADAFEAFLNRFPEHEQELNALYHLYTLYVLENNSAKADQYRQIIINRFPDSEYAAILSDPEYFDKIEAENRKVHLLYEDTYRAFESGQNRMVVIYSNEAESTYPKSELLPKFAFLRAMAKGRMNSEDTLIYQLQRFIAAYSSSEIVPLAQEMLATFGIEGFGEDELSLTGNPDAPEPEKPSIYSFKPDQNHFFVVIVNHNSINVDATRIRISDFNTNNYKLANLTINAVLIDSDHQMISVSNFRGKDIAMAYYGAITRNDYVFSSQLRRESNYFVISSDNYPIFYADKRIETYMKFFNEHYVK